MASTARSRTWVLTWTASIALTESSDGAGHPIQPVEGGTEGGAKARVVRREVGEPPVSPVADRLGRGDPRQDRVGDALAEQGVRGRRRVPGEDGAP